MCVFTGKIRIYTQESFLECLSLCTRVFFEMAQKAFEAGIFVVTL